MVLYDAFEMSVHEKVYCGVVSVYIIQSHVLGSVNHNSQDGEIRLEELWGSDWNRTSNVGFT